MHAIVDPWRDPAFVRAVADVIAVAIVAGAVGTLIVLRGIGFLGDALAHSIFPGVVTAFLLDANLLLGALVAGLASAAIMGLLTANARIRDNTSIGVVFTAAFALGVVILTHRSVNADELEGILFGDPLGAHTSDLVLTMLIGSGVFAAVVALRRLFVMASFDPSGARAMGLPVVALDVLLLLLTALTVVVAFKAVGNILVISLLITPAATARLFTDRLVPMAALACAIGVVASVAGVYAGYQSNAPAGGVIVLGSTLAFFAAWLFAPENGMVAMRVAQRGGALLRSEPEAVAEVILASPEIRAPHES
jgi:manganese/iron transport system permease protein